MDVYAAVIIRDKKVLLTSRMHGITPSLKWEFPGGKIEPGELPPQCLQRELQEELAIKIVVMDFMSYCEFQYPDKLIKLHFVRCLILPIEQEPMPQEGQCFQWVPLTALDQVELLPADKDFACFLKQTAII
jgi:8-oxo-dGTP diphosphatase